MEARDLYKKPKDNKLKKSSSGKNIKKSRLRSKKEKIKKALLKLTLRQIKYRQNRLKGMSIYAAARAAGYSQNYARTNASVKAERVVRDSIIDELEMCGATDRRQARELTRIAFESMETEKCEVYRDDGEGNIVVDEAKTERPDNYARLRGLEQIAKLKRQIVPASIADAVGNNANYTRVTIVLEKELDGRENGPAHRETKSRVALTNE